MGLFATLLSSTGAANSTDEESAAIDQQKASPSSLSVATVVQMYTDTPFEFEMPGMEAKPAIAAYTHLTYQAIPVDPKADFENESDALDGSMRSKSAVVSKPPDLGIWNCRVSRGATTAAASGTDETSKEDAPTMSPSSPLVDSLLSIPTPGSNATLSFCWKVDMSKPERVEPTLSMLQESLVRFLIQSAENFTTCKNKEDEAVASATTSLYLLKTTQFGLASQDPDKGKENRVDEQDQNVKISLQISVAWPSWELKEDEDEGEHFLRQQKLSLLYYHLRKYSAALNASLVFVSIGGEHQKPPEATEANDAADSNEQIDSSANTMDLLQPKLSMAQLGAIWCALAQGKLVWTPEVWSDVLELPKLTSSAVVADEGDEEAKTVDDATGDDNDANNTVLVYGNGTHAEDWIESALLRNAQYPGHWDASKDSIWKILPPVVEADTTSRNCIPPGDESWLQELRNSVAVQPDAAANSNNTPSKPITTPEAKTPDVSDYFASLLSS